MTLSPTGESALDNEAPDNRVLDTGSSPAFRATYPWMRLLLRITARALAPRLQISGRHHVPRRGPLILACNHISDIDPPFILNAAPRALWFMAKRELFEMRVLGLPFGDIIRFLQAFPVERDSADREALRRAAALLEARQAVVIFPEGRLSQSGEMGEIAAGAVLLALRARATVVPVGLWGTQHVMPYARLVPRPTLAAVRVHFGAPVRFDDVWELPRRQQREIATQRFEEALRAARAVARGEGSNRVLDSS